MNLLGFFGTSIPPVPPVCGLCVRVESQTQLTHDSNKNVVLTDKPANILERITFYDIDSKLVEKNLMADEKRLYLSDIKKDITYFRKPYERADLRVDISGLD